MPNRILKESICTSERIDGLTAFAETFYYRLIVNVDDFGRFDARPAILKSRLFPLKQRVTYREIDEAIRALAHADLVRLYDVDGRPHLYLPRWDSHQSIRAKRSRYPAPPENICKQMQADEIICLQMKSSASICPRNPIQSESESESESNARVERACARDALPAIDEVVEYCEQRGKGIDAQVFYDYYEARNWEISGKPVRDWKALVRIWEKRDQEKRDKNSAGFIGSGADISEAESALDEWEGVS